MNAPTLLAVLTIIAAIPLNWYVSFRLVRLSRVQPRVAVLRERAIVAIAVSIIVTVFAAIFVNNDLQQPIVSFADTKFITRGVILILSVVPALYWLRLYR